MDEDKGREEKKRTDGVENCLFGPLAAARHCKHPHHLVYSPTLFYHLQLPLSHGNCSPLSSSLLPNCVSLSPPFSPPLNPYLLTQPPPGSTPSLRSSRRRKKDTLQPRILDSPSIRSSCCVKRHLATRHYSPCSKHTSPSRHGSFLFSRA